MVYIFDAAGKKKKISVINNRTRAKPFSLVLFFDFEGLKNRLKNKPKTDKIENNIIPTIS